MYYKIRKHTRRFGAYIRRTYKNKLTAMVLIALGFLVTVVDGTGTGLVFMLMLGVPLFFTSKSVVE